MWFRVDDGFSDHAKVHALQETKHWKGAIALWTLAGSWCSKQETDGHITMQTIRRLGGTASEADALVDCGLWEKTESGYVFHGWAERNPLKSALDTKREQTRNRVTEWRDKRKRNADGNADGNAVTNEDVTPPPSRPVPSRSNSPVAPEGKPGDKPEPTRLMFELETAIGTEYFERNIPAQGAPASQRLEACKRADQAHAQGHFASSQESVRALAKAAVTEACKPGGKLGLALIQVAFTRPPKPPAEVNPFGRAREGV